MHVLAGTKESGTHDKKSAAAGWNKAESGIVMLRFAGVKGSAGKQVVSFTREG